ncbi:hypothetical protein C8J56DRAFT_1160364 [Mycena floridula]|nr:hypothetical protein C8J56DRAFT_1160364 [Mycena floridula]
MAASGSHIHNTVKDNAFGSINGGLFSNNRTLYVNFNAPGRAARHTRGYMPAANDKLFGRDQEVEEIVRILTKSESSKSKRARMVRIFNSKSAFSESKRARFALLGAGGEGKTALALKVMAHPAMKRCYSIKNSVWVPCEEAGSPALLLDILIRSLAITKDTENTIEDILNELRHTSQPIILLLDNFEMPWNSHGGRGAVASILRDISQFPHVALFITMRATVAPCEEIDWEESRIRPLNPEASHQLYASIDKNSEGDAKLPELLDMLGHMALAVKLMARHGKSTRSTVEQLISSYTVNGTAMLGPTKGSDPQNSVSISICTSLESSLVKDEPNAGWLLRIIATLPSGTTLYTLQHWWAPELQNCDGAVHILLEASLLERRTTSYFVLPVIRSYLLDHSHLSATVHKSLVNAACNFLEQHNSIEPSEDCFTDDTTARSVEEINLQTLLLQATQPGTKVIKALCILAWHQYHIRPRTEVIQRAVELVSNVADQELVGNVLHCYACILHGLNCFEESLKQRKLAREAYLGASKRIDAASMLLRLSDTFAIIESSFNEIPLIEQAQQEIESIDGDGKKKRSVMVQCLLRLGREHSRLCNHAEAVHNLTKARDLCVDLPFERARSAYYLAKACHRLRQLNEAEKWCIQALDEWKQIGYYPGLALRFLGIIYISKGQHDHALKHLVEGLEHAEARGDQRDVADILAELGRAHMKKGKGDDARTAFTEALANYQHLKGAAMVNGGIICRYYLDELRDASRAPTSEEQSALSASGHAEDIPE